MGKATIAFGQFNLANSWLIGQLIKLSRGIRSSATNEPEKSELLCEFGG